MGKGTGGRMGPAEVERLGQEDEVGSGSGGLADPEASSCEIGIGLAGIDPDLGEGEDAFHTSQSLLWALVWWRWTLATTRSPSNAGGVAATDSAVHFVRMRVAASQSFSVL